MWLSVISYYFERFGSFQFKARTRDYVYFHDPPKLFTARYTNFLLPLFIRVYDGPRLIYAKVREYSSC